MRTRILSLIVIVGILPAASFAGGDVGYRLATERLGVEETADTGDPAPMEFVDRAWTTLGVEESTTRVAEVEVMEAEVIELEFEFPMRAEESSRDDSRFFDKLIWPRTREIFRTNNHPNFFVFGGINLAR